MGASHRNFCEIVKLLLSSPTIDVNVATRVRKHAFYVSICNALTFYNILALVE